MTAPTAPNATSGRRPATTAYRWGVIGMLWLVCCFNYADRQAISVVFPLLTEEFGFDKQQLGLIASAFMWVYAGAAPLAGAGASPSISESSYGGHSDSTPEPSSETS